MATTSKSIKYVIYQDKRKGGTGKYYGKAIHENEIGLDELATRIQAGCTLKRSDITACIIELIEVMQDELLAGNVVNLDGLGSFRINIESSGSDTAEEYSATENIVGCHVRFLPTGTKDTATGKVTRTLTAGAKFEKATTYRA